MADLIDRDVFRKEHRFAEMCENCERDGWHCDNEMYSARDICGWLDDADTVDAVPVRRGRWKGIRYIGDVVDSLVFDVWMCSECGKYHYGYKNTLTNFCPQCGADMREGEKDG